MKPSWDDAPEWANWLAMDDDGTWFWYEEKPSFVCDEWFAQGRVHFAEVKNFAGKTLEGRPS